MSGWRKIRGSRSVLGIDVVAPPNKYPITNATIELDPQNNGSIVCKAFLVETISNLFSFPLIINASTVLSYLLNDPAHINHSLTLFARLFDGIVVGGLTSALWARLPNTKTGMESRKVVYLMLGKGEVLLIPIPAMKATRGGRKDAANRARHKCDQTINFWRFQNPKHRAFVAVAHGCAGNASCAMVKSYIKVFDGSDVLSNWTTCSEILRDLHNGISCGIEAHLRVHETFYE